MKEEVGALTGAGAGAGTMPSGGRGAGLLHRWLVEYNPMYLLSAAFVFGGLTLVAQDVAAGDSVWAHLGVPAIAELYALSLIAGAALLVRLGRRRPAAMLGLLAVLFQGDLMLHVESCSYLGLVGMQAAGVWLILFVVKLGLLGRALELRLSTSAIAVAVLGASGLALLPHVLRVVSPDARQATVAIWLFALGTAAVWTTRNIESAVGWDVRGRRCVHGAWAAWAVLAVGHALFWSSDYHFDLGLALAVVPLLAARYFGRESAVWLAVGVALFIGVLAAPHQLWVVALMAATTLSLVATRSRLERTTQYEVPAPAPPYRSYEPLHAAPFVVVQDLRPEAQPRLVVGALVALYVAALSAGWSGGPLPDHRLWLDALLSGACLRAMHKWHRPLLLAPLGPVIVHLAFQRGWISAPTTALGWGATSVGAGFLMLFGSLAASWRLLAKSGGLERHRHGPGEASRADGIGYSTTSVHS